MFKKLIALVVLSTSLHANVFEAHRFDGVEAVSLNDQEIAVINALVAARIDKDASEEEIKEATAAVVAELCASPVEEVKSWSKQKQAVVGLVTVVTVGGVVYLGYKWSKGELKFEWPFGKKAGNNNGPQNNGPQNNGSQN